QAKNQSKYSLDKKQKDADKQELLKLLSTKGNRKGKSKLKCCITKTDLK
ncbi:MAG: hypothetical protein K0S80_1682, partial [Neobacillus sp.]|nr:hypothetical protein [Neobacillus sp.]